MDYKGQWLELTEPDHNGDQSIEVGKGDIIRMDVVNPGVAVTYSDGFVTMYPWHRIASHGVRGLDDV